MKGSNKQFSRFLESEYNDIYLEPLDEGINLQDSKLNPEYNPKPQETVLTQPQEEYKSIKDFQAFPEHPKANKLFLNIHLMKEFVAMLGQDAQNCVENLKSLQFIGSEPIFQAYKSLYSKFKTVPVLFFSVTADETIYLWQINRLCPFKRNGELVLDYNGRRSEELCLHMSFMLLAKITPVEGEEILEIRFLGDDVIYVRAKQGEDRLIMKFYRVENFLNILRVNPYKQEVLANYHYASKVVMRGYKSETNGSNNLEITLWGKDVAGKDILLQTHACINLESPFSNDRGHFGDAFRWNNGMVLVADRFTGLLFVLNGSSIGVTCKTDLSLKEVENLLHVEFRKEKTVDLKAENSPGNIFPQSWKDKIFEWQKPSTDAQTTMQYLSYSVKPHWISDSNLLHIYDVPSFLTNPYLTGEVANEDNVEKAGKIKNNKIDDKYSKPQHTKDPTLKGKNEMLKEIRADIASKLTDVKKFDEEYKENEKKGSRGEKIKKLEEPEGVSHETLELYNQIKSDKKKIEKNREKEKSQKKKDRQRNDEL